MDDVEMSEVGAGGGAEAGAPEEEKVMADSGVAATVSVSLHPLVIMNISEHWTRSDYPRDPHLVSNVIGVQDQGAGGEANAGVRSSHWETEWTRYRVDEQL